MSDNFDKAMVSLVKEKYANIECPPSDAVWSSISAGLERQRRAARLRRLRPVAAVMFIIAAAVVIKFYQPVTAVADMVIRSIENLSGNTISIRKNVDEGSSAEGNKANRAAEQKIHEVQGKVSFIILVPQYVPKGYELQAVKSMDAYTPNTVIRLLYTKGGDVKNSFEVFQEVYSGSTDNTANILKEGDTGVETVAINGRKGILVKYGENNCKLIWDNGHINYKIDGNLSRNEIIKVAVSMK